MLSVVMLNIANDIFMLSLIMLSFIMPSLVRLNVIILNVVSSLAVPLIFGQALNLTCIYKTDQKTCQR